MSAADIAVVLFSMSAGAAIQYAWSWWVRPACPCSDQR